MSPLRQDTFNITFENTYTHLPEMFYQRVKPTSVKKPALVFINTLLAKELNIELTDLNEEVIADIFSGNTLLPGCEPIALAYAGHQFGHFVPQLGDGRAILLGEVINCNGQRRDIQLKGSGRTRFSREGDGRYALGPALREYIISEAMHALGIKTTRSLAVVKTGEPVYRETVLPGAILTRVASSHIRIGTFEYFSARGEVEALKILADYVIERHYPEVKDSENPYRSLLEGIINNHAYLVAKWMQVGFIHGVMNTDNTSIAGETIDYGPCAFMDNYDPATVFSSIDYYGRYSYGNQAYMAQWNLEKLTESLFPLLSQNNTQLESIKADAISLFHSSFKHYWLENMGGKIGIHNCSFDDFPLISGFLELMKNHQADFTLSFYYLGKVISEKADLSSLTTQIPSNQHLHDWLSAWRSRLVQEKKSEQELSTFMSRNNPFFIARNHQVHKAIIEAETNNNFSEVKRLISVLSKPYEEQPNFTDYMLAPKLGEKVTQTFCGT